MAQITINEISQNYTFNVGDAQYATVAMPITAAWGPAYTDPAKEYGSGDKANIDKMMEQTRWLHFASNQAGLESFVATFRGPASNWKVAKDYSYHQAITLLAAGYDVLVCRVCPGNKAEANFENAGHTPLLNVKAKYAGVFGNNLRVTLNPISVSDGSKYTSMVVYAINDDGSMTALENLIFCFDLDNPNYTDGDVPHISEVESAYVVLLNRLCTDSTFTTATSVTLTGGSDTLSVDTTDIPHTTTGTPEVTTWYALESANTPSQTWPGDYFSLTQDPTTKVWTATPVTQGTEYAKDTYYFATSQEIATGSAYAVQGFQLASIRYNWLAQTDAAITTDDGFKLGVTRSTPAGATCAYRNAWNNIGGGWASIIANAHMEWCYNAAFLVYQLLKDKLNYNPQRIISPGWDDQNIYRITGNVAMFGDTIGGTQYPLSEISAIQQVIMDAAFWSRCATGYIDIPKSCPRNLVWNPDSTNPGYSQMLARIQIPDSMLLSSNGNAALYTTHYALFAPWGQYTYSGTAKMATASPSFLALMIQRAQILNQSSQYEWLLPENRKHNLKIGKMDYEVPDKLRKKWQNLEGASLNIITYIPDYNINIWGNSTCYEVPPATYQALANLSTRFLFGAIENQVYKIGISITWQYNVESAYAKFYAGVRPLLDTMRQLNAITDYKIEMSADINGVDHVNANTVVGKIYICVAGVINDIVVDLIALPQGTSLAGFGE